MENVVMNVAWTTCVAATTLAAIFIQSLIVYYEPKNEALCHFVFKKLMSDIDVENTNEIGLKILDNLKNYNLQLRIPKDYISGLRFLRGTAFGALAISALMLFTSIVLFFFSVKVKLIEAAEANIIEVTRLLAFISLASVILCVVWIITYTSHLEMKNSIRQMFFLSDLQETVQNDRETVIK